MDIDVTQYQKEQPKEWWTYVPLSYFQHCLKTLWQGDTKRKHSDLAWLALCMEIGGWPKVRLVDYHNYQVVEAQQ